MIKAQFVEICTDVEPTAFTDDPFSRIPTLAKLKSAIGVFASQSPWHDSVNQPLPDYYAQWKSRYDAGDDMTQIIGQPALVA